jgi:hypothetical protein
MANRIVVMAGPRASAHARAGSKPSSPFAAAEAGALMIFIPSSIPGKQDRQGAQFDAEKTHPRNSDAKPSLISSLRYNFDIVYYI